MEVIMNYIRRISYVLFFVAASAAYQVNAADVDALAQPFTALQANIFANANAQDMYNQLKNFHHILDMVLGNVLNAHARQELAEGNIEQLRTLINQKHSEITASPSTFIRNAAAEKYTKFLNTLNFIESLPVLNDAYENIAEYIDALVSVLCNANDFDNLDARELLRVVKIIRNSVDNNSPEIQARRDLLRLKFFNNDEHALAATYSPATASFFQAFNLTQRAPFDNAEKENSLIADVTNSLNEVQTNQQRIDVACGIAGCIQKSITAHACEALVQNFIAHFNECRNDDFFNSENEITNISKKALNKNHSDLVAARAELLLAARIVLRACEQKPSAINNLDLANFANQISELKVEINECCKNVAVKLIELEQAPSFVSRMVKAPFSFIGSFFSRAEVPAENNEDNEDNVESVFGDVDTSLNNLDATQDDKVAVLRGINTILADTNAMIAAENYAADEQRNHFVTLFNKLVAKFNECFANAEAANEFMDARLKAMNVRAQTNNIKTKLLAEDLINAPQYLINALGKDNQELLKNFKSQLNAIYNAADARCA